MKFAHLALILYGAYSGTSTDVAPNAETAEVVSPNANIAAEIPNTSADAEFAAADKDGNGALSYLEFSMADQTCDLLAPGAIDQPDLNNDGELSVGEIVASLQTQMAQASDSDNDGKNDADSNNDGTVTHAELKQDSPLMAAMDMNRDGAVSASELIDVVVPTVAALDQDGNGKLSTEEVNDGVAGLFESVDINGDGQVSGPELQVHFREVAVALQGMCPLPPIDELFVSGFPEAAGADGVLNAIEFRVSYVGLIPTAIITPERADRNGDMSITPAEFQLAFENLTAQQVARVLPTLFAPALIESNGLSPVPPFKLNWATIRLLYIIGGTVAALALILIVSLTRALFTLFARDAASVGTTAAAPAAADTVAVTAGAAADSRTVSGSASTPRSSGKSTPRSAAKSKRA